MQPIHLPWLGLLLAIVSAAGAAPNNSGQQGENQAALVKTLLDVDRDGKGHRSAARAWAELTAQATPEQLPAILAAIDGAGPLAANWLRSAVDAVAARWLERDGKLPLGPLEVFLQQKQHDPRARRLAFEWIVRADPSAADRLIPQMLDDPSLELRRDAVARVLVEADKALFEQQNDVALATYQKALASARDLDQVTSTTEALKKLGHPVDLASHYGFLQDWKLLGPFDNQKGKGFDRAFPPETVVNLTATYPAPNGGMIGWVSHHTDNEYGLVDLNKALGKHMGAAAYAAAEFQSDRAGPVEIRLGTESANKIWLNGKLLASADVYHANGLMDQYIARGQLRTGRNLLLLKICQNEQTEDWAQDWKFQCRLCDASGKAILASDRPAPRTAESPTAANATKKE